MASKYYTTALAKVAGSSTQFTADIYLADAANVGSYGVELAISGAPANVTYTYTAATLTGFTSLASSEGGISGFSSSTTAGGSGYPDRLRHGGLCCGAHSRLQARGEQQQFR
jgi:hypothetical protein